MKKILLLFSSALLLLAGCAKEQTEAALSDDAVTFCLATEDATSTKAVQDGDGAAAKINHWVMEVRDSDGEVYSRKDESGTAGEKTHSFTVKLIKGQTYNILFWTDTKDSYNTSDLTNVTQAAGYVANKDSRDAFSAVVSNFTYTGPSSQNVTLYRPFGQLNIIFTDLADLYTEMGSQAEYMKYEPCSLKVTAKIPTSFNVNTQTAGDAATTALELTAESDYMGNYSTHRAEETIFMDYFFATAGSKDVIDLGFSFYSNGIETSHTFSAVPFQRNYRTNIKGAMMTSGATWNVTVDPAWTGEIDQKIAAAGSIAAANEALAEGKTNIVISNPSDAEDPIVFPAESNEKSISVIITGATGKTITFQNESGANGPANLFITSDSENLVVNCPNTHAEIVSGTYTNVTANTSATTLVVKKEVTVDNLEITGGNAEIHGIVNAITKASASVVTYRIETPAALKKLRDLVNAGTWVNGKVYLDADIDLNNEEWTPIKAYKGGQGVNYSIDLDGQNHTISNLKITGSSAFSYVGFFSEATDLTVKDLTFNGADLEWPSSVGENARGGVLVGNVWGINAQNVAVKSVTIKACQKVGALIGYIEGDTNVPNTVMNCSAENVSISSNQSGIILEHGSGGFIGHISQYQNPVTTISGCSVKNITIADYNQNPYSAEQLQKVPHVFVGSVVSNYTGDETPTISSHSIVFDNNIISGTNTTLPTCIYSSKYFGWGGNAEERPAWKGYIYVDGEKWVPDYSFECGGVKYATLSAAVAAASAESTVQILKAGTYTLCNIDKNITVKGAVEGVKMDCQGSGSIASIPNGATFQDIEFTFGNNIYHGFYAAGKISFKDCVLNGQIYGYGSLAYDGCTFNQPTEDTYAVSVYGSPAVTCTNCHFYGTNKAILMYTESCAYEQTVTVTGCDFHASSSTDLKAAVQMNAYAYECTGKYIANITNCTIEGFQKVYGFKHSPRTVNATVTVDGKVVYDGTLNMSLGSADDLVAFAAAVNAGNTYKGKTVYLENDVDLNGVTWIPAGNVSGYPSIAFEGTFDGQNHTIANMTTSDNTVNYASAGFFGSVSGGKVKNLNMTNVTVTSTHYAGAICGFSTESSTVIENCTVTGGTITSTPEQISGEWDNGDKAGGIMGYCAGSDKVTGCTVSGVTVRAYRDLGGIIGCANSGTTITDNTVNNSTIIQDNTNAYKSSVTTYHEIIGNDYGATATGNTFTGVTLKSEN